MHIRAERSEQEVAADSFKPDSDSYHVEINLRVSIRNSSLAQTSQVSIATSCCLRQPRIASEATRCSCLLFTTTKNTKKGSWVGPNKIRAERSEQEVAAHAIKPKPTSHQIEAIHDSQSETQLQHRRSRSHSQPPVVCDNPELHSGPPDVVTSHQPDAFVSFRVFRGRKNHDQTTHLYFNCPSIQSAICSTSSWIVGQGWPPPSLMMNFTGTSAFCKAATITRDC
ncbi:hypothetical protein CA11_00250 [Gimesia maris]|nr:hypothetical protein CA11_00250 [Gimesia maris]